MFAVNLALINCVQHVFFRNRKTGKVAGDTFFGCALNFLFGQCVKNCVFIVQSCLVN